MRKLFSALLILSILISLFSSCSMHLSDKEAKRIITDNYPGAIILECTFSEKDNAYTVDFTTVHNTYEGIVDARSGKLLTVQLKEKEVDNTIFTPPPEKDISDYFISPETALETAVNHSVSLNDSAAGGTAMVISSKLDSENQTHNIIFRSGDTEYNYIINAVTNDIISFTVSTIS